MPNITQMRRFLFRSPPPSAPVGGATTTWNPADKDGDVTLSNGNLTATVTNLTGSHDVRSIANHSSGKYYCELTFDGPDSNAYGCAIGIVNSSQVLTANIGFGADGGGLYLGDSNFWQLGASNTGLTPAVSNVFGMAVDTDNAKIWFRKNGGSWNNDGSANPATNTNGIAITFSGAVYVAAEFHPNTTAAAVTANFGATSYADAAPAGFGNW